MGLGGATKKLQKVADMGEELYGKMNELREQILEVRETVGDTNRRVAALENKVDQQGALLEALAYEQDIDVDAVLTEVAIEEAEPQAAQQDEAATDVSGDTDEDGDTAGGADPDTASDEDASADADETTEPDDDSAIAEAESDPAADGGSEP